MYNKLEKQFIERLDVKDNIINTLRKNKVSTLGQLCNQTRIDLKNIGLEKFEIDSVDLQLQLNGMYLRQKN